MPFLTIHTNAKINDTALLTEEMAKIVAQELGKPLNYVVVALDSNPAMAFNGSEKNLGALLEMKSIGFGNKKAALAEVLTTFMLVNSDVEVQLVNIEFVDLSAENVAIGGSLLG